MLRRNSCLAAWALVVSILMMGCAGPGPDSTPQGTGTAASAMTETPGIGTATPDDSSPETPSPADATLPAQETATPTPVPEEASPPMTLTILEDSRARYLVREQFLRLSFPTDAVGETSEVTGTIVFVGDGTVVPEESMLVVDLQSLRSDDADRDDFLRGESLESDRYPLAEYVVLETPGLPWPLPREGQATFELVGEMTLHNYTRPLTWEATAEFSPDLVVGSARTSFTFGTFHMVRPSRPALLLSVEDNIRLELDFVVAVSEGDIEPP